MKYLHIIFIGFALSGVSAVVGMENPNDNWRCKLLQLQINQEDVGKDFPVKAIALIQEYEKKVQKVLRCSAYTNTALNTKEVIFSKIREGNVKNIDYLRIEKRFPEFVARYTIANNDKY